MTFPKEIQDILESWIMVMGKDEVLHSDFGKKGVVSYSGGKDSSILLLLYEYLHTKYLIPRPFVFHLNHLIRDNQEQETEIELFLKAKYPRILLKKKIFPDFPIAFKRV